MRLSAVCLHFYYVDNRSSNRLHAWRVCCCGPKGVVQYGHATRSELINYRTAVLEAARLTWAEFTRSENGHCTSDTEHTGLLRAKLLIR